jgi:hypothetical protein
MPGTDMASEKKYSKGYDTGPLLEMMEALIGMVAGFQQEKYPELPVVPYVKPTHRGAGIDTTSASFKQLAENGRLVLSRRSPKADASVPFVDSTQDFRSQKCPSLRVGHSQTSVDRWRSDFPQRDLPGMRRKLDRSMDVPNPMTSMSPNNSFPSIPSDAETKVKIEDPDPSQRSFEYRFTLSYFRSKVEV